MKKETVLLFLLMFFHHFGVLAKKVGEKEKWEDIMS